MAILVTKRWSGPRLQYGAGGIRATEVYDVSGVGDFTSAKAAVIAFDPSTGYNRQHPYSPLIYCDGHEPTAAAPGCWAVSVSYSNNPAGRHFDPGNPLAEPVKYSFQWGNTTEGCDRDAHGNAIQNTAGQSPSESSPTDVISGFLTAERVEPFYDARNALAFSNAVNTKKVGFGPGGQWILEPGQACSRRAIPLSPITAATIYVVVQYVIELRAGFKLDADGFWDGFKIRRLNEGTTGFYAGTAGATRGPIVEVVNGQVQNVASPVRLDAVGKPIESTYKIGKLTSPGYADPIANPVALPSTTIIENAGDAYFVKQFPQTMKLLDLGALGL